MLANVNIDRPGRLGRSVGGSPLRRDRRHLAIVAEGEPPVSGEETLIAKPNAVARWLGSFDHYTDPEDICQRLTMGELEALLTEVSADAAVAGVAAPARLAALLVRAEPGIEVLIE